MTAESRSVVVRLSMEASQYIREAQRTGAVGAEAMSQIERGTHRSSAALDDMGRTAGRVGLLAAAGLGVVILASSRFDKSMSAVQAATHETTANMGQLRLAALEAGKETVFSATEAAGAIEELAKAGVQTKDVIGGGLRGALNLATAGNIGVQESAELAASAMNQFNLAGSDVPHIADLMAAAAGKAQGGVHELGAAFNQSALVASQMGLSIEETTASLAAFASQGLIGSDAGTSFKTMLLALNPQTLKAKNLMEKLGFSAYDAQGQFVGMEELARRLQTSLAGMSEQQRNATLQTLFGRDAIRAANALYEEGATGIAKWTAAVDDQGYAAETAATRMDNLLGDIEKLRGSLETAFIGAGDGSQGQLRGIVRGVTSVVDAFNKLPPASQSALTGLLAISAVTSGAVWLGSKVVGKVTSVRESLDALATTSPKTARGLKVLAAAGAGLAVLEIAGAGISALQAAIDETLPGVEVLTSRLLALKNGQVSDLGGEFDSLGDSLDRIAESDFSFGVLGTQGNLTGFSDMLSKLSNPIVPWDSTAKSLREANAEITALDEGLANLATTGGADVAQQAFVDLAAAQGLSKEQTNQLRDLLPSYTEALSGASNSAQLAGDATDSYAKTTRRAANGVEYTAAQVKAATKAYQAQVGAAREVANSFLDISNGADDAKVSLREWIQQMNDQAAALEHFTDNAIKAGKKGLKQGLIKDLEALGPVGALRMKQLANATDEEIARANRAWQRGRDAVKDYIDATTKVPKELRTTLTVENAQALQHVRDVSVALRGLNDKTIYITTIIRSQHQETRLGDTTPRAVPRSYVPRTGGLAGSYTSDSGLQTYSAARTIGTSPVDRVDMAAHSFTVDLKAGSNALKMFRGSTDGATSAQDRAEKALERAQGRLDRLLAARSSYASDVGSSFNTSPFGGGLAAFDRTVGGNTTQSDLFKDTLRQLADAGLDGPLFKQLAASGDLKTALQLLATGAAGIQQRETAFAGMLSAQNSLGNFAGNQVFGSRIDDARGDVRRLNHLLDRLEGRQSNTDRVLDRVSQAVEALPGSNYRAVKAGAHDGLTEVSANAARDRNRRGT